MQLFSVLLFAPPPDSSELPVSVQLFRVPRGPAAAAAYAELPVNVQLFSVLSVCPATPNRRPSCP